SYEEPAFDLYPLTAAPSPLGEGRVGTLPAPLPLAEFARRVREMLKCGPVQVVGESGRSIGKVAIVWGAGGELMADALRVRADAFLTGEMRFHDYLAARAQGLALVLPGHYATERPGVEELARRLAAEWPDVESWASTREADPVAWA